MISSPSNRSGRKAGRKPAHYVTADNKPIEGLARRPSDGRWRIIGTDITFTEPDERLAIHRFRTWQRQQNGPGLIHVPVMINPRGMTNEQINETLGPWVQTELRSDGSTITTRAAVPDAIWSWVREQILARPAYVAEQTGIEQIGYLRDLKPPAVLPTFADLRKIWDQHFTSSKEQKSKCPVAWNNFTRIARVASLKDITPDVVIFYRDAVYARKWTGKSQSNLFNRIRRYLSFFKSRAISVEAVSTVLGYLQLLTPNESTVTLDPRPVERDEFQKLLAAAEGEDKAMILLMLNGAFYLSEVIRLQWEDITDGCIITHRKKTGRCVRVCVLWPETLNALAGIEHAGPAIFYNNAGSQIGIAGAEKRWRKLRESAKVDVTSSQLRDGAYTACVEANITSSLCQLLVGHRSGIADHYVKRKPAMVAPACEAVHRHYL
jgi:integrase